MTVNSKKLGRVDVDKLRGFFFEAAMATYASDNKSANIPFIPGSNFFSYSKTIGDNKALKMQS